MTTVAALRTGYLNQYLHRLDAATKPWSATELDQLITDTLTKLWPRNGILTNGDTDTDSTKQLYSVPGIFLDNYRISRIELVNSTGLYLDKITNWRQHDPYKVIVHPLLPTGYKLRFYGWVPFQPDASDLPTDLEETVAHGAASRAYGGLAAELVNSERQQNLDSGRIVSYDDAVGLAAYHARLFVDGMTDHPSVVSYGPRNAHRR